MHQIKFRIQGWQILELLYKEGKKDISLFKNQLSLGNLRQGKRRINRALRTMDIESTDCDVIVNSQESAMPVMLDEIELNDKLNNVSKVNLTYVNEIGDENKITNVNEIRAINFNTEASVKQRDNIMW